MMCLAGVCSRPGTVPRGERCLATRDCVSGLYCDRTRGVCAPGGSGERGEACGTDAQCRPPLYCGHTGFFGACTSSGNVDLHEPCTTTEDCLAGLYCGVGNVCAPYDPGVSTLHRGHLRDDEAPFRAYFEVPRPTRPPADFFRLPFPSDVRVRADGTLDLSDFPRPGPTELGVDLVKLYVDTWTEDFEGFSSIAGITFRFSGEIDFTSATQDAVLLIDVTPGATQRYLPRLWRVENDRTKYSCAHTLTLHPWTDQPLLPRHTYAAIVTTSLRSTKQEIPGRDPDLAALLGTARPTDVALARAWDVYAPLRAWLATAGAATPDIAGATVFTVQDMTGHMARLAGDLATRPPPTLTALTLCGPGVTSPCDDGTPARACGSGSAAFQEIHGRFSVPIYQSGTAPYETPAQGGAILEPGGGGPAPVRTEAVCFALALPKTAPPAAGWPLVVYHHGTGGSMRSAILDGTAGQVTGGANPAALFAFDAVAHGARRGASRKSPDDLVFNPLNPRAARDNFLQGAVDVLQALRLSAVSIPPPPRPRAPPSPSTPASSPSSATRRGARRASSRCRSRTCPGPRCCRARAPT